MNIQQHGWQLDESTNTSTIASVSKAPRPVMTALGAGLVAAGCAAAIAVSAATLPPAALTPPAAAPAPSGNAPAATPAPASLRATPAGRTLTTLGEELDRIFPRLTGRLSARGYFAYPAPTDCSESTSLAYDGFTWFGTANGRSGAVSVTAIAVGPGYAAQMLEQVRRSLRECRMRVTVTGDPTAGAFVATGEQLRIQGWARGDLVLFTIEDSTLARKSKPAAARVDAKVVELLTPVCADLEASSEVSRNPYLGGDFTGRTTTVGYSVPVMRATPAPGPVETIQWTPPGAVPFPQFAVAEYPDALPQAPLLVDPYALPAPQVSTTAEPVPPAAPALERGIATARIRVPDTVGPGCGWDFLGVTPPQVQFAALEDAAQLAAEQGAAELALAGVQTMQAALQHAQAQEAYAVQVQEWAAVTAYQEELRRAQEALIAAREAWLASFARVPTPTPTPTPTPVPALTPVPEASTLPSPATPVESALPPSDGVSP